jgi:hypothetical protein
MMGTKRKSPLKEMIDKSLSDLHNSGFAPDDTLESEITGPERFAKGQKAKDEVIIDSQLADIAGREGYFLKLKKELRPGLGEWMLMKTIENDWRQWPDTETEVAKIVKEHTKVSPAKWGTGPYRIEYASKLGVRGKTYPPRDFYINAEEEFLNPHNVGVNGSGGSNTNVDPTTAVTAQLDMLGRLLDVTRGFQPTPLDPAKIQEQQAAAFKEGLAIKAGENSSSTAMITTMMTGMMAMMTALATNKPLPEAPKVINPTEGLSGMLEVMKTFGVIGQPQEKEKQKTTIEFITELKALGMDLFEKKDPIAQLGQLKQLANIAGDLMGLGGTGEKPGILEKIVDMVGPAIPGMIKDLKDTAGNVVQAQVEAGRNIERTKIGTSNTHMHEGTQMHTTAQAATGISGQVNPQVTAFFNGLYDAVRANNRLYYPIIYASLLQEQKGVELVNGIVLGTHTAKELIDLLQGYGDQRFKDSEFVMKHLVGYTNGYIVWLRDMVKPKSYAEAAAEVPASNGFVAPIGPGYDVECVLCHQGFVFESEQEFAEEQVKVCGHNGCVGALQPVAKVS